MSLKLYIDLMSQPSRALYILLNTCKYKFETKLVDLRKAEHLSDDYTQNVNRFQKVPVIDHNGFILTESVAIVNYLSRENIIPDGLYPKESKARARVHEFLEWHHAGLRLHCAMYFRTTYLDPIFTGRQPTDKQIEASKRRMLNALEDLDVKWLGSGQRFVTGDNVSVADLFAACELEQPRMAGYDPCVHYKNINDWMSRVKEHFNPHYEEGHAIVNKVIRKNEKIKSTSKL